jgi:hypothetical protein
LAGAVDSDGDQAEGAGVQPGAPAKAGDVAHAIGSLLTSRAYGASILVEPARAVSLEPWWPLSKSGNAFRGAISRHRSRQPSEAGIGLLALGTTAITRR